MGAAVSLATAPMSMAAQCCGSLAGGCVASALCKACSCMCVAPPKVASVLYFGTLVIFSVLAMLFRAEGGERCEYDADGKPYNCVRTGDWVIGGTYNRTEASFIDKMAHMGRSQAFDYWNSQFSCAPAYDSGLIICCANKCAGVFAVYRFSFALCLFFAFLFVCTIGTSRFGARVHRGLWFGKAFVLLGLLVATLFVDNSAMAAYRDVAQYISFLFLIMQILLLIDFGYRTNEYFVELDEASESESACSWKMCLLGSAVLLYVASITMWVFEVQWFGGDGCGPQNGFIAVTIVLCVALSIVSCTKIAPHGTILTSSIITCYASYLCYSAFRSKPADGSNCNPFDKAVYPWQDLFMGIVIYTISMATTAYSASGMESATVVGKTSDSSGTVANDALTVTLDDGSNGNSDGTKKAADDDEDAPVGKEQWYSYHFMMAVSAFYMAMLLSDWSTQGLTEGPEKLTEGPEKSLSISIESFWVKILSMWACLLLYGWTLLAPYLLRNYREFPGIDFD